MRPYASEEASWPGRLRGPNPLFNIKGRAESNGTNGFARSSYIPRASKATKPAVRIPVGQWSSESVLAVATALATLSLGVY